MPDCIQLLIPYRAPPAVSRWTARALVGVLVGFTLSVPVRSATDEPATAVAVPEALPPSERNEETARSYTAEEMAAEVKRLREERREWEQRLGQMEQKGRELEREYRASPHRPLRWRAEKWLEAMRHRDGAQFLRMIVLEWDTWDALPEIEEHLQAGRFEAAAELAGPVFDDLQTCFEAGKHEIPRILDLATEMALTSSPSGLPWTFESTFDQDKTLVISGQTPVHGKHFLGNSDGVLTIHGPGGRDYRLEVIVMEGEPWGRSLKLHVPLDK